MKTLILSILGSVALFILNSAHAADQCYKVTGTYTGTGTPNNNQVLPADGPTGNWSGACDSCNGKLGLPPTINVSGAGTTIAWGQPVTPAVSVPFTTYGRTAGYDPNFILARCHPNVTIYEAYSTNGDNNYSGKVQASQFDPTFSSNDGFYATRWQKIAIRITNNASGEYFRQIWQQREIPLTAEDTEASPRGYRLVRARHLTSITTELNLMNRTSGAYWGNGSRVYSYTQPNAYIALQAPGLSNVIIGSPHDNGNWNGWYGYYPGAIGLYHSTELRFTPSCVITNHTPYINFPDITVTELESGGTRSANINVTTQCDQFTISGTATNQTSIGFVVNQNSIAKSIALGLRNSNGGISHFISNDYDNNLIAKGVGVRIYRGSTAMNLLQSEDTATSANSNTANLIGWYPVLPTTTETPAAPTPFPNEQTTTQTFTATFGRVNSLAVTTGAFLATGQIVVKIQ